MKRRIYVAGAYTAITPKKVENNIKIAEWAGRRLAENGFQVYVPHLATPHWDDIQDYRYFADLHFTMLTDWSTDIYMLPRWRKSSGSVAEERKARKLGIPIYKDLDDLLEEPLETQTRHLTKLITKIIPYETKRNIDQDNLREILIRTDLYLNNYNRKDNPKLMNALAIVEKHLRGKITW